MRYTYRLYTHLAAKVGILFERTKDFAKKFCQTCIFQCIPFSGNFIPVARSGKKRTGFADHRKKRVADEMLNKNRRWRSKPLGSLSDAVGIDVIAVWDAFFDASIRRHLAPP